MEVKFSKPIGLLLLLLILLKFNLFGQCDPSVIPIDNYQLQYRDRNNRCEGVYRSPTSSGSLSIVGVTLGTLKYQLNSSEVLKLSSPINKELQIRGQGIPIKSYYRMDATILPNQTMLWPLKDVIFPLKMTYKNVGIYSYFIQNGKKILAPVSVTSEDTPVGKDMPIYVYFRASEDVSNVKWRFSEIQDVEGICNKPTKWVLAQKAYFKAGERMAIKIPAGYKGLICIRIKAEVLDYGEFLNQGSRSPTDTKINPVELIIETKILLSNV